MMPSVKNCRATGSTDALIQSTSRMLTIEAGGIKNHAQSIDEQGGERMRA